MCNHEFIGHENGVTCNKCGLNLTTMEYRDFLNGEVPTSVEVEAEEKPVTEKPKRQYNRKKVSE